MDPVALLGSWVDRSAPGRPDRARALLEAAYSVVALKGRLTGGRGVVAAQDRCNGAIASMVVDSLRHPETSCVVNIFLPCELLHAAGVAPMIPEVVSVYVACTRCAEGFCEHAEAAGVPESFCSYHKLMLGMEDAGVLGPPALVANTTLACDANQVSFRAMAEAAGAPHFVVDVPQGTSEEDVAYVADQLRDLEARLCEVYGGTVDGDELRARVARSQHTLDTLVGTLPLRRGRFIRNNMGLEMQYALVLHTMLGTEVAEDMVDALAADLAAAEPYDGIDLVWSATAPFFSVPLQKLLDVNTDQQVIASDMCFDQPSLDGWRHDGAREPYLAMAERLIRNSYNGPASRRVDRMRELCERTAADGAVVFCHWGCKETMGCSQLMRRTLEADGFPCLSLDGDGCNRGNFPGGQAATRLGAFLEMLHKRRDHGTPARRTVA